MRLPIACRIAAVVLCAGLLGCGDEDAMDEAMSGVTLWGTPVAKRSPECFPAESRDLLWEMDQVADQNGKLQPLDFDANRDGHIDDGERDAIRGRNTWLVWGGGNEVFWNWLQEQGYGITDFLILLDSRERDHRFERAGVINQPGLTSSTNKVLGLYLDQEASEGSAWLGPPGTYYAYKPDHCNTAPFEPWAASEKARASEWEASKQTGKDPFAGYVPEAVQKQLVRDGFDPAVYGYPSGVFGLRLWLNPDFFADTEDAATARAYWRERVENTNDRYYTDPAINADPELVRPFRVSMSCGFCHIGPHPLSPPDGPEHPEWENLSGIIGGQYWSAQPALGNLLTRKDFLYHFLLSQAPGTVDTSLISTDHINNTNVINAVFDVPARLTRAGNKAAEEQGAANLLLQGIEDDQPPAKNIAEAQDRIRDAGGKFERHFPMVLFPGEDSVGVFGALARVYLNIGVFSEQWNRVDNPVIGFTPQRPFSIETARNNSTYWNANEQYRVKYLAKFFTLGADGKVPKSTAPMRLEDAPGGRAELSRDSEAERVRGREVFLDNCAICHSSKQPAGFALDFDFDRTIPGGWSQAAVPTDPARHVYPLPTRYEDWEAFRSSAAMKDYRKELRALPDLAKAYGGKIDERDEFIENNFLSNELRIPVTLVGTYSGRAMATNAMRGQVWDNFSSETFKNLESVGDIHLYDPYLGMPADAHYGTNSDYRDGREKGGPGYYRPASLISVWATAPYFHNNALGIYTHDPSVDGRLRAFRDGIRKLLCNDARDPRREVKEKGLCQQDPRAVPDGSEHPGDLRLYGSPSAADDPGYIYRVPVDTQLAFGAPFNRPLLEGILRGHLGSRAGGVAFWILSAGLWLGLAGLFVLAAKYARARHLGALLLVLAVVLGVLLALTGTGGGAGGTVIGAVMMLGSGLTRLASASAIWLWATVVVLGAMGLLLLLTRQEWKSVTRGVFALFALVVAIGGFFVNGYLNGRFGGIRLGPIPRGTPVNLLMNIDPEKAGKLPAAIVELLRAMAEIKDQGWTGDRAYEALRPTAGPKLIGASKVPDFVLDRGHWFGEHLTNDEKEALIAFLETL